LFERGGEKSQGIGGDPSVSTLKKNKRKDKGRRTRNGIAPDGGNSRHSTTRLNSSYETRIAAYPGKGQPTGRKTTKEFVRDLDRQEQPRGRGGFEGGKSQPGDQQVTKNLYQVW